MTLTLKQSTYRIAVYFIFTAFSSINFFFHFLDSQMENTVVKTNMNAKITFVLIKTIFAMELMTAVTVQTRTRNFASSTLVTQLINTNVRISSVFPSTTYAMVRTIVATALMKTT